MTIIEMLQATPRVLYTLMVYGDNLPTPPNILFAKGHYRFALLVGRVGIEPTHHFWYSILSAVRLPVPPSAHLCGRVFLLPRDSLCNGHSRSYLYSMREEFNGAQRRSWTFKHWFLRPAALPVCIFAHIRSGATIVLYVTNPARKRVCTNWIICLLLAANWSLLTLVSRTRTLHIE